MTNSTPASHRPSPHKPRPGSGNVYCLISADGKEYLTVEEGFKPLPQGATAGESGDQAQLPGDAWIGGHREGLKIKRELRGLGEEFDGVKLAVVDLGEE